MKKDIWIYKNKGEKMIIKTVAKVFHFSKELPNFVTRKLSKKPN